jgi:hypothetical protein
LTVKVAGARLKEPSVLLAVWVQADGGRAHALGRHRKGLDIPAGVKRDGVGAHRGHRGVAGADGCRERCAPLRLHPFLPSPLRSTM